MLNQFLEQLLIPGTDQTGLQNLNFTIAGSGDLKSVFQTSELALNSVASAALALRHLAAVSGADLGPLQVDRRLCSLWFKQTILPIDWKMPDIWDAVAGDYQAADHWIRLHTNKPEHRDAALSVLECPPQREAVTKAVRDWQAQALEAAIVQAGGCAAQMMSRDTWQAHEQGQAVALEPLIDWASGPHQHVCSKKRLEIHNPERPLAELKVLDLTRVIAGPVCTRFLAAFGARVLRVDEPGWEEPFPTLEMSAGKQRCGLDLKNRHDLNIFKSLLSQADVLVHGLRSDALERLGLGVDERNRLNPELIDVALCAYGWTGPWSQRRGFDSLVQMSNGIAYSGMQQAGAGKPIPLPCQALDHATGYLMAAAVLSALASRQTSATVNHARLSLARTGEFLASYPTEFGDGQDTLRDVIDEAAENDYQEQTEITDWGPARRLRQPLEFANCSAHWQIQAGELRTAPPVWPENSSV